MELVPKAEKDNLILIQGSVPGSKNGVVLLRDAIKYKTPAEAPFPAGFLNANKGNNHNPSSSSELNEKEISSKIEGGEVEN